MARLAVVAVVAAVAGCDSSLAGTWVGEMTVTSQCGSAAPTTTQEQHSWLVERGPQGGHHVSVGLGCDTIGLDLDGGFVEKLCPEVATATGSETPAVEGGSLGVDGSAAMNLVIEVISGAGNHYCTKDYAGSLVRQ